MSETTIERRAINTDFVRIEDRDQFLTKVPKLHPDDPRYARFWSRETKRCLEGMWGEMFGGYRYMRGPTYFYGNYFFLQETDRQKQTYYIKPRIDDLEWEISYYVGVCRGFSGFAGDAEVTCLTPIRDFHAGESFYTEDFLRHTFPKAFRADGTMKRYEEPYQYIRKLHDKPLGRALYENETYNGMVAGSRGGGKSYFMAGEIEHTLLFDGATIYNEKFAREQLVAEVCIGSGDSDKSSELVSKIVASINAKADYETSERLNVGVWGEEEVQSDGSKVFKVTPIPLYRDFVGSTLAPNKRNPLRYETEEKINGRWVTGGTGTRLYHVNYSDKKADGAQAAAGGRYLISLIEEAGLSSNLTEINRSNDSTVARDGVRFGSEFYIGTSGNLLKAQSLRRMMENPQDYHIYPLKNRYGTEGKDHMVAFFLPFYMTIRTLKDENGNTDFKRVAAYVESVRKKKASSSDPEALRKEKMNRPCWIDEMWLSLEGNLMPYDELDQREKELLRFNAYEQIEKPVRLIWDPGEPYGVKYAIDHTLEPYRDFPINTSVRERQQGCVVLYDIPQYIDGIIPPDMYCFIGHDSYVEEDITRGGSIGSVYVLMNPKYAGNGLKGNTIVAAYNDKPLEGLDKFYENVEKLISLYGGNPQSLWFEKNRGDYCRSYFVAKHKAHFLALTPQWTQGTNMYQRRITSYGYHVGNRLRKMELAKVMRDWLLEETELDDGIKCNALRLPDLFLIRQLKAYNLDDNFDAVDGFRGCVVGLREYQRKMESDERDNNRTREKSILKFYLRNPKIFRQV